MKFKVKALEWYMDFSNHMNQFLKNEGDPFLSPQEIYEIHLKVLKKDGNRYVGPLRYIEKCDDPGFPKREGVQYCVRIQSKKNEYWKKYECYCYQLNCWWKAKKPLDTVNSEFYVPQLISQYDYDRLKIHNTRILNDIAKTDVFHYAHQKHLNMLTRRIKQQSKKFRNK